MKVSLEQLVNTNYIKYSRMIDIVNAAYAGSDATNINIYIDMYSMIKVLYSNKQYEIQDYSALTACMINMCAHYRDFFRTRYQTESKIFIIYSKNCSYVNNQFYPDYNRKNAMMFATNKKIDDMILNNVELLKTLCPYLPDIHFVTGTFETGVLIYDLICRNEVENPNTPHMIITKDIYNYQLVPMRNNITIVRPKKVNGVDVSYFINNNNLIDIYLVERKTSAKPITTLHPGLLSLIMTLSSVSERNIKSLFNITTALRIITTAVANYRILNGYNSDIETIWNAIYDTNFDIGYTTFEHRFKAIDIMSQYSIYLNTPEPKNIQLINLYDPEAVKAINNKYFKMTPLDLNRL